MIKIIIADDHHLFIEGIHSLIKSMKNMEVVAEVANGKELLAKLVTTPCDIILMDINMPEMDGIEATKQVRANYPGIKILMLTMFSNKEYIEKLLRVGANGYLLKNTGIEELKTAIETVVSGESYFSKEVTERIMEGLQKKKAAERNTHLIELTEREIDVLKLIVQECTTAEIAEKLFISTHTVETHRKNLISKLNVRNIAGLVKYAMQNGLVD
jgi:two-component system nitrate/nitrite response regulator NarL